MADQVERTKGYTFTLNTNAEALRVLLSSTQDGHGNMPKEESAELIDVLAIKCDNFNELGVEVSNQETGNTIPASAVTDFKFQISVRYSITPDGVACNIGESKLVFKPFPKAAWEAWYTPEKTLEDLSQEIKRLVGDVKPPNQIRTHDLSPIPAFLQLANSAIYHKTQEIIAKGAFSLEDGEKWPTGHIRTKDLTADVQIKPDPATVEPYLQHEALAEWQSIAANTALEMNDETADVLDYITYEVIGQAKGPDQDVIFSSNRFNQLRGLEKQKSGKGRRGGFKTEYRRDFSRCVDNLSNTWIRVSEMEVVELDEKGKRKKSKKRGIESRAIVISARAGQLTIGGQLSADTYRGRLGPLFAEAAFGPWRQTALVSVKALSYDHYHQRWEKRLTRYLSWQWRIRQGKGNYLQPFDISTLLDAIGEEINKTKPLRTKERLEKALDTLHRDGVIAGWQYCDGWNEDIIGRRGWAQQWQSWKITIEPPQEIFAQYQDIPQIEVKGSKQKQLPANTTHIGEELRQARLLLNLSQLQAAEEIGINQATISRIERGMNVVPAISKKVKAWLSSLNS